MEKHIRCDSKDIARYVFCPGDYARAKKMPTILRIPAWFRTAVDIWSIRAPTKEFL